MDIRVLFRTESLSLYSDAEMKKIEQVIRVFYNYLRDSSSVELLWSDKVGYLLIPIDVMHRSAGDGPKVILNAGALVAALLQEIEKDVAADAGKRRMTRKEYPEYQRRVRDYLAQLPEYSCTAPAWARAG